MKTIKYLIIVLPLGLLTTCRKKSDIEITAYNYALGEPIANAEVIIVESTLRGGLFNASSDCREIASATTNKEGRCAFDNLKLKTKKGVQYAAKIKYSYGKSDRYNCNVTQNSEVKKGSSNKLILNSSTYDSYFKVQYNNLLNPSIPGDSIIVYLTSPKYEVPGQPYPFGGGGVFNDFNSFYDPNFPYPEVINTQTEETNAGKHVLKIYKKKMGVVTQTIDTIKIYPYETKMIEINW